MKLNGKVVIPVIFCIMFTSLIPPSFAGPIFKQVTLEDLGILQLAAHDLFLVDRVLEMDFENGLLDLSTLFTDMKTGLKFSDTAIGMGGETIPIDTTSLLLAGTQMTASWLVPVMVAGAGIVIVIARRF